MPRNSFISRESDSWEEDDSPILSTREYYTKRLKEGFFSLLPGRRAFFVAFLMLGLAIFAFTWPALMFEVAFFLISSISAGILWGAGIFGGGAVAEFAMACVFAFVSPLVVVTAYNLCEKVVIGLFTGLHYASDWLITNLKHCFSCCTEEDEPSQDPMETYWVKTGDRPRPVNCESKDERDPAIGLRREHANSGSQLSSSSCYDLTPRSTLGSPMNSSPPQRSNTLFRARSPSKEMGLNTSTSKFTTPSTNTSSTNASPVQSSRTMPHSSNDTAWADFFNSRTSTADGSAAAPTLSSIASNGTPTVSRDTSRPL